MNILKFRGVRLFIGLLLVLLGAWIITASIGSPITTSVVNTLSYPFRQLTNGAASAFAPQKSAEELFEENSSLNKEVTSLREQLTEIYDLKKENEQLKKYYNIKSQNTHFQLTTASVTAKDNVSGDCMFTLDKGITSGVVVNNPVLTEKGLVGWVSAADITSCTVTTLLSENTSISVTDKRTSDTGILTSLPKHAKDGKPVMIFTGDDPKSAVGDIIVTSGIGGVFPADLLVGSISEILYDEYDTFKYAVITPYENISQVSEAVIITDTLSDGN